MCQACENNPEVARILTCLARHHRRATYGALSDIVGGIARAVMQDHDVDARHSWVVTAKTKMPANYPSGALDPNLAKYGTVIADGPSLKAFLDHKCPA